MRRSKIFAAYSREITNQSRQRECFLHENENKTYRAELGPLAIKDITGATGTSCTGFME